MGLYCAAILVFLVIFAQFQDSVSSKSSSDASLPNSIPSWTQVIAYALIPVFFFRLNHTRKAEKKLYMMAEARGKVVQTGIAANESNDGYVRSTRIDNDDLVIIDRIVHKMGESDCTVSNSNS